MSVQNEIKRLTAPDIRARKGGEPIVCLTSYHAHTARLVDKYCDVILVGDSLGMVMHGLETTVPVTLDMMILQGHAVMRGSQARAGRGRHAVRLLRGVEGAGLHERRARDEGDRLRRHQGRRRQRAWRRPIAFLVERGVPVMGHVGLTPQAINTIGSFRAQGREENDWAPIEDDAKAVAEAGAFSVVIEAVAEPLARSITAAVRDPDHRHRRERRPATARSWCWRTCWACRRGCRNSSSATATSAPASRRRSPIMPRRCAPARFPGPEHVYR